MIKKYAAPFWCWFFGHDKFYPYPNREVWGCARCANGPHEKREGYLND